MKTDQFVSTLKKLGFGPFTGVPDSIFLPLINYLELNQPENNYVCSSEGEAMGIAGGFALAGRTPVVYMQNDGYGNAVNPLSSLQLMNDLPALLLISWRAEPGEKDEPQHWIMGETIRQLLDIFKIPYDVLGPQTSDWEQLVAKAKEHCLKTSRPFALIIKKGTFDKVSLPAKESNTSWNYRHEYIKALESLTDESSVLLGATGYCGRELYQLVSSANKFYMMGSMGCLAAVGLGLAKEYPKKKIFVLDCDGALLMKMGTLSTIGFHKPDNFIHVCFNNETYESTGGQKTTASTTNFPMIAKACGYPEALCVNELSGFKKVFSDLGRYPKPLFVEVKIRSGTLENLERPKTEPVKMKMDFMDALKRNGKVLQSR